MFKLLFLSLRDTFRNLKQAEGLGSGGRFLNVSAGTGNILLIFFLFEGALQREQLL